MTRSTALLVALLGVTGVLGAPAAACAQVQQLADSTYTPTVAEAAFTTRHPKILFDEAHHNFHTMDGRYQAYAKLMAADGCVLTPNKTPFSAATLKGYDVLVIANAMGDDPASGTEESVAGPAFTKEEIEAVHAWVNGGGALLLIADHSPFGSAASAMSNRFGVDMSQGYAGDSLHTFSGSVTNIEFTRENKTLGDGPIMNGRSEKDRVNRVVAFTGQSLKGPAGSTPMMLLSEGSFDLPMAALKLRADPGAMMKQATPAKGRCMAVALQVGKGRVVVQGEAGMLAAQLIVRPEHETIKFGMNQEGLDNQQYALNEMRWLAGEWK
jgi:hypothetical protein